IRTVTNARHVGSAGHLVKQVGAILEEDLVADIAPTLVVQAGRAIPGPAGFKVKPWLGSTPQLNAIQVPHVDERSRLGPGLTISTVVRAGHARTRLVQRAPAEPPLRPRSRVPRAISPAITLGDHPLAAGEGEKLRIVMLGRALIPPTSHRQRHGQAIPIL